MHLITTPPSAARTCDARLKTGRRSGQSCGAIASRYDGSRKYNLCRKHAIDVLGVLEGTGPAWYDEPTLGCDTPGHAGAPLRRVVKGVRMCMLCSFEYQLTQGEVAA